VFDLRYHVASLSAVFLALIIGILVGVAITRGGFVSKAERKVLNDQIAELRGERDTARDRGKELEQEQRARLEYVNDTYPSLAANRLDGKRIAFVSVGPIDPSTYASVREALRDAGAPAPVRVRAIKVPVDDNALDGALDGRPALAKYEGKDQLPDLGRALGDELVRGGRTPLWDALTSQLVEERSGDGRRPADAVVVVRSVKPQQGATARFLDGLYAGIAGAGSPAVGAEVSSARPSAIPAFSSHALSTADSVNKPFGKLALVLLLAGASPGHYGVRATASDGVLPRVDSAPVTTTGG
jgi:hypothetical protein